MKTTLGQLRSLIREAVVWVDPMTLQFRELAATAIKDLAAGGTPEDVYGWLSAETEMPDGTNRANVVVVLVKKKNPAAGAALERVSRSNPPKPYVAPWSGTSGKMY